MVPLRQGTKVSEAALIMVELTSSTEQCLRYDKGKIGFSGKTCAILGLILTYHQGSGSTVLHNVAGKTLGFVSC